MVQWELRGFVERLHRRYNTRMIRMLEDLRTEWMEADDQDSMPGSSRPGAKAARYVNEELKGSGVFLYAAHPSQSDDADDYQYAGPRWYVTCSEAVMKHYRKRGVAPPPPGIAQDILWPLAEDRRRPWLTEVGWTLVPENSEPQVMHADICHDSSEGAREPGHGRYHHFAWKMDAGKMCSTNVVSGAFTEGTANWDHYAKWEIAQAPAIIFDSEMLHRGGRTLPGVGWTTTLTLQVCSGAGWERLKERVSSNLMWYTQPMGWEAGDAVDAYVEGTWRRAKVVCRDPVGSYTAVLEPCGQHVSGLSDVAVRYRRGDAAADHAQRFIEGSIVEANFDGEWYEAKVERFNDDNTYRVLWREDKSFTDGIPAQYVRAFESSDCASDASNASESTTCSDGQRDGSGKRLMEGTKEPAKPGSECQDLVYMPTKKRAVGLPSALPGLPQDALQHASD